MFAKSNSRTIMPLALLAAVAMTCLQGAAFAGAVPLEANGRMETISVTGLNLASPEVQAQLEARIQRAVRSVCAPADYRDLRAMADRPACEKAARASADARRDVLVARAQSEQLAASAVQREATAD